ncbi:type II/IV secretion system protein [Candidatus Jorgensenbacteria bacterium]|nr:type II/IV secretion system protein [Candidatus Jorgensenbacteria bacterium]
MLKASKDLEEQLLKQRRQAEENDAKRRADRLGLAYIDLISVKVPTEIKAMRLVPEEEAKRALLVPLQVLRKKLIVAAFDPDIPEAKKAIEKLRKIYETEVAVVSMTSLKHAWSYYHYVIKEEGEISGKIEIDETKLQSLQATIKNLEQLKETIRSFKSPLVSQTLEIIIAGALSLKASDIHLEPNDERGAIRLRIDGLLHAAYEEFTPATYHSVVTRIKLLSNLKLNITDQPQDGRFTIGLKDRDIEIRTSVIPSEYGETVVLRILDPLALKVNLEELGWRPDDLAIVKAEIAKPNGLILNTGPTGSGKTTTLYAFLKYVFRPEIKVITVEDPIEYHLDGISQTQVDPGAGYTFASGLRSILRQDPNVILVGEIRDKETAEIAMNAALTGHIVFSTLHTNDAVGAVPRLIDLGAKPQILGPALALVIAQRLIRILCPQCKTTKPNDSKFKTKAEEFLKNLPSRVDRTLYKQLSIYEPKGCDQCGSLGYRGRISIFELFVVNENIEQAIYANPTELTLTDLAKKQGMTTMQEDGILKMFMGITSQAEVERLTGPINWLKD